MTYILTVFQYDCLEKCCVSDQDLFLDLFLNDSVFLKKSVESMIQLAINYVFPTVTKGFFLERILVLEVFDEK